MIDFKTHIELFKSIKEDSDSNGYIESLDPLEKLKTNREISEVYPIKESKHITDHIKNNFSATLSVEDAVLGQFIMLEQIITGKTKFNTEYERDFAFSKLLLRPKHHKEFDNENPEEEEKNKKNILDSDVKNVYGCIYKYMSDRERVLFKQFSGVFYNVRDYDEEEESEKEELIGEDLFHSQWYWYNIVRLLAQEDIRRYGEIYMLKMSTVLPEMSFLAQKNKIEKMRAKQSQMMHKL